MCICGWFLKQCGHLQEMILWWSIWRFRFQICRLGAGAVAGFKGNLRFSL